MREPELVFVYGTLRRGQVNHPLLQGAQALGPARTKEAYALYLDDFPYLLEERAVCPIVGELYGVSPAGLKLLDQLEEHPLWYERRVRPVLDQEGRVRQAWVYFFTGGPRGRLLASGDLAQARERGGEAG